MIDPDQLELWVTLAVLAVLVALFILCNVRMRRPVDPRRPRLIPYSGISIFLGLAILITAAHTISVFTGHKLEGRTKMKGQQ